MVFLARTYTIYVCAVCGSDNIEASTASDSLCGDCGEWMNVEPVEVAPTRGAVDPCGREREALGCALVAIDRLRAEYGFPLDDEDEIAARQVLAEPPPAEGAV